MEPVAISVPLVVGATAVAVTIIINALAVAATVHFVRRATLGTLAPAFWTDVVIVAVTISFALCAHLFDIGVWAVLFRVCGEFPTFGGAYYHSAVNYTTLGYGDVIMTRSWRFLGPFEAASGMVLFGVSTAVIIAVIQHVIQARFPDLRA
jgi:hypothetical protein